VVAVAAVLMFMQWHGSYAAISRVFRWLAFALLAYVAAAFMARPDWRAVLHGTLVPSLSFDARTLGLVVACIGTSLSVYVYTWQSNQEVEERIADGEAEPARRKETSPAAITQVRGEVVAGMIFSNFILYAILLCTGATLHAAGKHDIDTAAQAAEALKPLAGPMAQWLFAAGVVAVGCLAFPVMTTGAAYDLAQALGRPSSLHARPREAPLFHGAIIVATVLAIAMNFLGLNPMRALLWSGIVQGFTVPPMLALMMIMTSDATLMGEQVNGRWLRLAGWFTVVLTALAGGTLVVLHFLGTSSSTTMT
jgi:Mn2+/Fe2+ NRAMP family transporter